MEVLAVGSPYPHNVAHLPQGSHYNYDSSGHWLHYLFDSPTNSEIDSVQRGPAQFSLFVMEPVIFVAHQFGEMPWNDSPYSWWMVPAEYRGIPTITNGEHAFLRVVLVDTKTGFISAIRALTFSTQFTQKLHQEIVWQSQSPWDQKTHDLVIKCVYNHYSSVELARESTIHCKGGE